jgi:hypothetical protein
VQESVLDEGLDRNPCEEDEDFFASLPNAEEMEQAIGKFQAALSWREPTGIHGSISHYIQYIPVYTSTY